MTWYGDNYGIKVDMRGCDAVIILFSKLIIVDIIR